jgi:hypothetical protein
MKQNQYNTFQFTINNPRTIINTPKILNDITKIRINSLRYITASNSNKYLLLCINGLNNKINGTDTYYLKSFPLSPTTNTPLFYENLIYYDNILKDPVSFTSLSFELLIDGIYNSDISSINPVVVEIQFD